jgi:hypothetical protein
MDPRPKTQGPRGTQTQTPISFNTFGLWRWYLQKRLALKTVFGDFFRSLVVFLNSPHRETPKNVGSKKNRGKCGFGFFWLFLLIFLCFWTYIAEKHPKKQ